MYVRFDTRIIRLVYIYIYIYSFVWYCKKNGGTSSCINFCYNCVLVVLCAFGCPPFFCCWVTETFLPCDRSYHPPTHQFIHSLTHIDLRTTPPLSLVFVSLAWLLIRYTFSGKQEQGEGSKNFLLVEVGPRLSFESAISSNAKSICRASGIDGVTRLEVKGGMVAAVWCKCSSSWARGGYSYVAGQVRMIVL